KGGNVFCLRQMSQSGVPVLLCVFDGLSDREFGVFLYAVCGQLGDEAAYLLTAVVIDLLNGPVLTHQPADRAYHSFEFVGPLLAATVGSCLLFALIEKLVGDLPKRHRNSMRRSKQMVKIRAGSIIAI